MLIQQSIEAFLEELASASPAPGGGSAAALAAALGIALTSMVCRLTIGKKKYAEVQTEMEDILRQSEDLRLLAARLVDEDSRAFQQVMAAYALPKEKEEEKILRRAAIQEAIREAIRVPLEVIRLTGTSIRLARAVAEHGNRNSVSDAGVAVLMLQTAFAGAHLNVQINLAGLEDRELSAPVCREINDIKEQVDKIAKDTMELVNGRFV